MKHGTLVSFCIVFAFLAFVFFATARYLAGRTAHYHRQYTETLVLVDDLRSQRNMLLIDIGTLSRKLAECDRAGSQAKQEADAKIQLQRGLLDVCSKENGELGLANDSLITEIEQERSTAQIERRIAYGAEQAKRELAEQLETVTVQLSELREDHARMADGCGAQAREARALRADNAGLKAELAGCRARLSAPGPRHSCGFGCCGCRCRLHRRMEVFR